ncbi:aldose epimerase family protein [Histidinibacterium aquaticum]|uniref:Galactose mutarotase n=1 Tax=Histidinibacterium aquaticum TaxID=2613962 RepID=A0A5J5GID0_9RHOB|nr:aldose epimerase family protein [Histidinibacterium aquaticum]KAA9007986.1 galactose mutarotase [Histidinibacterium aquaticum]
MREIGTLADGSAVHAIDLAAGELSVTVLTWGAVLREVRLAGVDHNLTHVPEILESWTSGETPYHGALVAPVANRFTGGKATLDGEEIDFERNQDGVHMLHSGSAGTHAKLWDVVDRDSSQVTLAVDLPAGEGNFPGNRRITARFSVAPPATLRLEIEAETDAPTFLNATNHSYWKLSDAPTWEGHSLRIAADRVLPTDETDAPTGEIAGVAGTPMDFRESREPVPGDPMLDHNFCLSDDRVELRDVLWLTGPTGLTLTLATTEPGMQVYDGWRSGHDAIALEPQGWPDAPNHAGFPSIVLRPGETYRSVSEWRFSR